MNEKIRLYYYGTSSRIVFVRFLGELKTPKRHLKVNYPLAKPRFTKVHMLIATSVRPEDFAVCFSDSYCMFC